MPDTRLGRASLWLLLPVLLYPLYWSVFTLIPDSWRWLSISVSVAVIALALTSLVVAGIAIVAKKERSLLLILVAGATFLLVAMFAVGEAIGH